MFISLCLSSHIDSRPQEYLPHCENDSSGPHSFCPQLFKTLYHNLIYIYIYKTINILNNQPNMKPYCNLTYNWRRSNICTSLNLWQTTFITLLRLDIIELLVLTPDLKRPGAKPCRQQRQWSKERWNNTAQTRPKALQKRCPSSPPLSHGHTL